MRTAHYQQLIGSFVGSASLLYFVFNRRQMPRLLTGPAKVLIWWMIFFLLAHNIAVFSIISWQEIIQWYGVVLSFLLYNWKQFLVSHNRIVNIDEETQAHFNQLKIIWNT
uniref:Uncharacterized protein n=1 Tax=Ditylenchus dipsaci TaxID=166011 RepID=A0A915CZ01_9BILA